MTKGVTGFLAELLIADGRLDENRLVKSYVPELADTPFGEATVRDALDMKVNVGAGETSGATDVADAALWSTMALNSRQSAYDTLAAVKADGPNDGNFHYASMTTEVAGWVITRAAGQPYEKLASDLLWSKLGLQDDIVEPVDPTGKVYASTGLTISARDLAKLGLMIADHGQIDGQQVFPANVIDISISIPATRTLGKTEISGTWSKFDRTAPTGFKPDRTTQSPCSAFSAKPCMSTRHDAPSWCGSHPSRPT